METSLKNVTKPKSESKCSEEKLFIYFKIWIFFSEKVIMWQYFPFFLHFDEILHLMKMLMERVHKEKIRSLLIYQDP